MGCKCPKGSCQDRGVDWNGGYSKLKAFKTCLSSAISSQKGSGIKCQKCYEMFSAGGCEWIKYLVDVINDLDKRVTCIENEYVKG